MNIFDLILLSVALAMDCFTVSIACGVILRRRIWGQIVQMALLFGLFQAAMPLIGWLASNLFSRYIEAFDHWIAFALLLFLGGRMIKESFEEEKEHHFNPLSLRTQLLLAVATSIDALAVGISFSCIGYTTLASLTLPLIIIGVGSFLFSATGSLLGVRFGKQIARRLRPELLGGIILIFIGIKILLEHTGVL